MTRPWTRSLGKVYDHLNSPDATGVRAADQNQRAFYGRWAGFMQADGWQQLATWQQG